LKEDESRNSEQREPLGKEKIEESGMERISEVADSRFQKLAALTLLSSKIEPSKKTELERILLLSGANFKPVRAITSCDQLRSSSRTAA